MSDKILESLFLDHQLWAEAIEHGVDKRMPQRVLESFQDPHFRAQLCRQIAYGQYTIEPPHTAYIPKDDGRERLILVNNPQDRLLLHIVYKWLIHNTADLIHPSCRSYQEGVGIGSVVQQLSRQISHTSTLSADGIVGYKYDIHKYFDSVSRSAIHRAFDAVESRFGRSSVVDLLRSYYDSDFYYDTRRRRYESGYYGIKQGCAVSSWLANVILNSMDSDVSTHSGCYVRYSDDIIYVGSDHQEVSRLIVDHLASVGLKLNEDKIEPILPTRFVRFLGYNIRGCEITLSAKWVKSFRREVDRRTIRNVRLITRVRRIRRQGGQQMLPLLCQLLERAQRSLACYLYLGDGRFSWASHVLGIVNRADDLQQMHLYCLDALRAVFTGKTQIGGLGVSSIAGIVRGRGRHVGANRLATDQLSSLADHGQWLSGYVSLSSMQHVMSNRWLYRALIVTLTARRPLSRYATLGIPLTSGAVSEMEHLYDVVLNSLPDGKRLGRFYARSLDEMTTEDLLCASQRSSALDALDRWIATHIDFAALCPDPHQWYWQSPRYPQLVLLRQWFV